MTRDDDGMTIVELLIAMVILMLIMAPLATSFVLGLGTTRASELDAADSADAQLLSGFFDIDVASAQTVATASSATCGSGTGVLQLVWKDGTADRVVAYEVVTDSVRQTRLGVTPVYVLQRVTCSDTAGTVIDTQVVARTLATVPSVSCDKSACSTTPRRVTLKATAYATQTPDAGTPGRYTFSVTATRKVSP